MVDFRAINRVSLSQLIKGVYQGSNSNGTLTVIVDQSTYRPGHFFGKRRKYVHGRYWLLPYAALARPYAA